MVWETCKVCNKCPIHHETQCSHCPHLPHWLFTDLLNPFHAATSLAGKSEPEVSFYFSTPFAHMNSQSHHIIHNPYLPTVQNTCFDSSPPILTSIQAKCHICCNDHHLQEHNMSTYIHHLQPLTTVDYPYHQLLAQFVLYVFQTCSCHITSLAGKSKLEVSFHRCFDPIRAATTPSLPQL